MRYHEWMWTVDSWDQCDCCERERCGSEGRCFDGQLWHRPWCRSDVWYGSCRPGLPYHIGHCEVHAKQSENWRLAKHCSPWRSWDCLEGIAIAWYSCLMLFAIAVFFFKIISIVSHNHHNLHTESWGINGHHVTAVSIAVSIGLHRGVTCPMFSQEPRQDESRSLTRIKARWPVMVAPCGMAGHGRAGNGNVHSDVQRQPGQSSEWWSDTYMRCLADSAFLHVFACAMCIRIYSI
jgi:hypothetical protein